MKTILLLRHAKSAWDAPGLDDHDRPLNRRGEKAARTMGEYLAASGPLPELILCSTAMRARQTLAPLIELLSPAPPISLEKGLYMASEDVLLDRLRELPSEVENVLLIGHNDGIWLLAETLAGHGKSSALASLRQKYPTGTLTRLSAPVGRWADLRAGSAELQAFVRPRDLVGA